MSVYSMMAYETLCLNQAPNGPGKVTFTYKEIWYHNMYHWKTINNNNLGSHFNVLGYKLGQC